MELSTQQLHALEGGSGEVGVNSIKNSSLSQTEGQFNVQVLLKLNLKRKTSISHQIISHRLRDSSKLNQNLKTLKHRVVAAVRNMIPKYVRLEGLFVIIIVSLIIFQKCVKSGNKLICYSLSLQMKLMQDMKNKTTNTIYLLGMST